MIVNVINQQTDLKIATDQLPPLVKHVLAEEEQTCDEVNIYLVDTPTICQLHEQFFQDPSPTDCISFPLDDEEDDVVPYRVLGEVFVCPQTAKEYAQQHEGNPYDEVTLYVVHGLLHLMGYDDLKEEECAQMRQAEKRHMQKLRDQHLNLK